VVACHAGAVRLGGQPHERDVLVGAVQAAGGAAWQEACAGGDVSQQFVPVGLEDREEAFEEPPVVVIGGVDRGQVAEKGLTGVVDPDGVKGGGGEPVTLEDDPELAHAHAEVAARIASRVAAVRGTNSGYALDIYTRTNIAVKGTRQVRIIRRTVARNRYPLGSPSWTPDGRSVMFDHQDGRGASAASSLWIVGADGRGPHRLTDPRGAYDAGPIISPDGRRIVFLRSRGTGGNIVSQSVVMNADGSAVTVLFDYLDYSVGNAVWSPDSRSIAFNPGNELWIVNASTGSRHTTTTQEDGLLDWQAIPGGPTVRCADRGSAPIPQTAPPVKGLG